MTKANAYTENLGTDWIATDAAGTPIARASDEASLRQAAPDAKEYLNAKTIVLDGQDIPRAAEGSLNAAFDKVAARSAPAVDDLGRIELNEPAVIGEPFTAKKPAPVADGSKFDHDRDGKAGGAPKGGNRKTTKAK